MEALKVFGHSSPPHPSSPLSYHQVGPCVHGPGGTIHTPGSRTKERIKERQRVPASHLSWNLPEPPHSGHHFYLHFIGQNLVKWECRKRSLYFRWPCVQVKFYRRGHHKLMGRNDFSNLLCSRNYNMVQKLNEKKLIKGLCPPVTATVELQLLEQHGKFKIKEMGSKRTPRTMYPWLTDLPFRGGSICDHPQHAQQLMLT